VVSSWPFIEFTGIEFTGKISSMMSSNIQFTDGEFTLSTIFSFYAVFRDSGN